MSILKSIKGTLKTVQDDFSEGLKSITGVPEKPPTQERFHNVNVNLDAGGELLHSNESIWKELFTYTEDTGKRAQGVDVDIAKLLVQYEKQSEILTRLHHEAANLPMLLTQLQDITNTLAHVEEEYDKVEAGLVHLENLNEMLDYQREVRSHHNQLAVYNMKKDHEIQKYKVHLAKDYANKLQQIERKREQLLKERQSAYDDQFSNDVDFYKKHGKLERLSSTTESEKKVDVGDVEIEEDTSALDDFLASSASDLAISEPCENAETIEGGDVEDTSTQVLPVITSPEPTDSSGVASPTSDEISVEPTDSSGVASPTSDDLTGEPTEPASPSSVDLPSTASDPGLEDISKDSSSSEQTSGSAIDVQNET